MNHSTKKRIHRVCRKIRKYIPSIDYGGCGIAALAIVRSTGIKKFDYVFVDDSWERDDFEEITEIIPAPAHVVLMIGAKFLDSKGFSHINCWDSFIPVLVPGDIFIDTLDAHNGWNTDFDREENVPILERILNIDLSDIHQKEMSSCIL